jgi:hypothetical protein
MSGAQDALDFFWATEGAPVFDRSHVVKGLLLPTSLIVVYGDSNSGKTYFLLDVGVHIVAGRHWRGQKVTKGLVVYIAGEGVDGIQNRVAAYRERGLLTDGAPLAIVTRAADFLSTAGDVAALVELIGAAEIECGEKCVLVIVDTLSRAMPGGDENSAEAMTRVVANADFVRQSTGAAVAFIHHAGKDATRGARGHSSLRAAADTEILVEGQSGPRKATVVKQRDLAGGQVFGFELELVVLGTDQDGDPVTACVVRHTGEAISTATRGKAAGKNQTAALTALREWVRSHEGADHIPSDQLAGLLKAQGIGHKRKPEVLAWLANAGVLTPAVAGFTLNREAL